MKNIRIAILALLLLIVIFTALAGRCFYLQFCRHDHYSDLSEKYQSGKLIQKPQRGIIIDCGGRTLAASNTHYIIFAEPRIIKDPIDVSNRLSPIINIPAHEICKIITEAANRGFVRILDDASFDQCRYARKIRGIGIQSEWKRYYPTGSLFSNIVGLTDTSGNGLSGIELACNEELTGSTGSSKFLADVARRPIRPAGGQKDIRHDGFGVILTLDSTIQEFARHELLEQYKKYHAESAIAIVANPATGAILAMVSLPDFDPNDRNSASPDSFRNRVITDQYEPGSIFKPIAAAIALDCGAINTKEKIDCEKGRYSGKGFGTIGEYKRGFGNLNLSGILVNSSNIGMAKIGQKLGKQRLYDGLKLFGFGKRSGLEIPGEVSGLLWPVDRWTGYSVTRIPFGQEISVTAMQLIKSFCIISNGGRFVRPFIIRATVDPAGEIKSIKHPPAPVGYVIKPEVSKWLTEHALSEVVNKGTGKRAKLKKWQVFGKTGTANIANTDKKGYSKNNYIASFIAGAPAKNPRIVVLVSIRNPDRSLGLGYTGGTVAAPAVGRIIEKSLTYLENQSY